MLSSLKPPRRNYKASYVWPPSELPGDPTYLRPAVGAPHPVAAPLLEQQHLAARAVEGLALLYQVLTNIHRQGDILEIRIEVEINDCQRLKLTSDYLRPSISW